MTLTQKQTGLLLSASLLFVACAVVLPAEASTASTVTNSVSVNAHGGGSQATIRTVVDGEIVEDKTITGDNVTYTSQHETETGSVRTTVATHTDTDTERLRTLLTQLQALIELYELLLRQ